VFTAMFIPRVAFPSFKNLSNNYISLKRFNTFLRRYTVYNTS
jgi:hypothetical protein